MCLCEYMHISAGVYNCVHQWKSQEGLSCPLSFIVLFETESLPKSGVLSFLARPTSHSHPPVSATHRAGVTGVCKTPSLYMGAGVQTQVLRVVQKATLTIELSL